MRVPVSLHNALRGLSAISLLTLAAASANAQVSSPVVLWSAPNPVAFSTPLGAAQLNAQALAGEPVIVPLASAYNKEAFKTSTAIPIDQGYDFQNSTIPAELFGASAQWRGITFPFGPQNQLNAVAATTIPLPPGAFAKLLFLGSMVNNYVPPGGTFTFVVTYTDGTSATFHQAMSDWVWPLNHPGEENVACSAYRYYWNGTNANSICLYGYELDLDPTRTPASLTLPPTTSAVVVAAALVPPPVAGTFAYTPAAGTVLPSGSSTLSATFTPADPAAAPIAASVPFAVVPPAAPLVPSIAWPAPKSISYGTALGATQLDASAEIVPGSVVVPIQNHIRIKAIRTDGHTISTLGFDNHGLSFPASQLGDSVTYRGTVFPLLPPLEADAATSTTLPLPSGSYTGLQLIASASGSPQRAQPFTVQYADGTSATLSLDLSPWNFPQGYPAETIVATTDHALDATGASIPGSYHLYGYQLPLDPTRSPVSLTLPSNLSVVLFAAGLVPSLGGAPVSGSFTYTPPPGTFPYPGDDSLSVSYQPDDPTDLGPATASNHIVVSTGTLQVVANPASRVYGAPNPAFSGSLAGVVNGDPFTESFSTAAVQTSAPGTYPITPSVAGPNLDFYTVQIVPAELTVARAPVIASVVPNVPSQVFKQNVTFTATVASTTIGTPTGSVEFSSGGTILGSAPLSNGVAAFTTVGLPAGQDEIAAQYSGDENFQPLTLPTASVNIEPIDFTLGAAATLVQVPLGGSATVQVNLVPKTGNYQANVLLSAGPSSFTVKFSPGMIPSDAGPRTVTVTISAPHAEQASSAIGFEALPVVTLAALLFLPLTSKTRRQSGLRLFSVLFVAALLASTTLTGCGSGFTSAIFPVTLTASDGTHTHTVQVQVQVIPPQ